MVKAFASYVVGLEEILNGRPLAIEIIRRADEQLVVCARTVAQKVGPNAILEGEIHLVVIGGGANGIGMIVCIQDRCEINLAQAIDARGSFGSTFDTAQNRQQQRRQNSDDGDDHQQFDQTKAVSIVISHVDWTVALLTRHE